MAPMSPATIDRILLEVLREIARDGEERRIKGKTVRLAGPKGRDCVYKRIVLAVMRRKDVTLDADLATHFRELEESLRRLTNRDLLFNNGGGATTDRSYWVVMD